MNYDQFRDEQYHWNCNNCKFCNPKADLIGVKSTCKRLDHKHLCFAKATFYSYDCGQRNGCICSDFQPSPINKWLCDNWNEKFMKEYISRISDSATMNLCIDQKWNVKYKIKTKDFVLGTFLNEDGSLKWIRKEYYKKSKKSVLGYVYCNEYPDGEIIYGANTPVWRNNA